MRCPATHGYRFLRVQSRPTMIWRDFQSAGWLVIVLTVLYSLIRALAFVVTALSLHRLAIRRRVPNPWLAWIPVIRYYLLGQLIGSSLKVTSRLTIPSIGLIMPFTAAFMILLSGSFAGQIASVLTVVLAALSFMSLFRQYREPRALAYGLLAGLPFVEMIGCFLLWQLSARRDLDAPADPTVFHPRS